MRKKNVQDFEDASEQERVALQQEVEGNGKDFEKDNTGKLAKALEHVLKKYRPELGILRFLTTWRYKEKLDDGKVVEAEVFKMSPRDRDIFGYDVRLEIYSQTWHEMSKAEKIQTLYHELRHIQLNYSGVDEEGNPADVKLDKQGRISFKIVPHDIDFRRFHDELDLFGLLGDEKELITHLYKISRKSTKTS